MHYTNLRFRKMEEKGPNRKKLERNTTAAKQDSLLDQMPQFLANANAAAVAHAKALGIWKEKYDLSSDREQFSNTLVSAFHF